jgi:O-methyltransferase involved in polyketide biosynthesis
VTDGSQAPAGIDPTVPTAARMYDYWLGGHNNFAADRIAALKVAETSPQVPLVAKANRAFLGRVVRYLTGEAGIRQFLDLGAGLPTKGNVHQVAQAIAPGAHVVYVDKDPMVHAHARALKTGDGTAVIHADLCDTDTILRHPETTRLIDFSQPLAILSLAVLHFVPEPDVYAAVAAFTSAAPAGSYLALSHVTGGTDPRAKEAGTAVYARSANPVTARPREQILAFFDGLDIVEPGLVPVQQWRPDDHDPAEPGVTWLIGGVGRNRPDHVAVKARPAARPRRQQPRTSSQPDHEVDTGSQAPPGIDPTVATAARMYDYWLGGHNNFAADRIAALKISERSPEAPLMAQANRKFLGRAVRYLASEAGIRQFLDLGTGLPTRGSVHHVAQAIAPGARVVYVDKDPMVLAHARALKTGDNAAVIHADLRDTDTILSHPDTRRLIDFGQPLAVLFVSVLHFVADPDAHQAVARLTNAAAPGSHLVLSHATSDRDPQAVAAAAAVYQGTASPARPRTREAILGFFAGLEILPPGLVPVTRWRPDEPGPADTIPEQAVEGLLGGIGRKPLSAAME